MIDQCPDINCRNCGAVLRDGKCDYCGARHFYEHGASKGNENEIEAAVGRVMKVLGYEYNLPMLTWDFKGTRHVERITLELMVDLMYEED